MKRSYILTAIMIVLTSCGNNKPQQAANDSTETDSVQAADTVKPVLKDTTTINAVTSATALPNHTSYNGKLVLSPQHKALVSMTMAGKILSTPIFPGKYVTRGTVLATVDNPEFINLQRDFIEANAQLTFLKAEYDRQTRLGSQEAASQKRVQQSRADYLSMQSRYQADAIQLKNMGVAPASLIKHGIRQYFHIFAPISGYIGNINVNIGKYVQVGEPICAIIDKSNPMICLTAYEKDLGKLSVGNRVNFRVNGFGKTIFHAHVTSISQEVDNTNRSIEVYAKVKDGSNRFRPGMYVSARVENK